MARRRKRAAERRDCEAYAVVAYAMEEAFVRARGENPDLVMDELAVALLLVKDCIIERHIDPAELSTPIAAKVRELYRV